MTRPDHPYGALFASLLGGALATAACTRGDGAEASSATTSTTSTAAGQSAGSGGAGSGGAGSGGAGSGGAGGGVASTLDELLAALRADRDGALLAQSRASGWPAPVEGGYLVVSTDPALAQVAGDHDGWTGVALTKDEGFAWAVVPLEPGDGYKLKSAATFSADPWSRAYRYDDNGELSLVAAEGAARFDRHFAIAHGTLPPRTVRVRVPKEPATHLLYLADGQNLFDPAAPWGGWRLDESAPGDMMLVGIDNTAARMDEYTHVADDLGSGAVGGLADAYADLVEEAVRPLVLLHYGEPSKLGVMGSSLGGLVSLHLADRAPASYHFAASLSGTLGWGSIGAGVHEETIIERLAAHGHQSFAVYLDSGGSGTCADTDADGIDDDGDDSDNYCVTKQLEAALAFAGYTYDQDFSHWHEPGAEHNEAAWAARVFRPLAMFAGL